MTFDPTLEADPNGAGNDAGSQETDQGTQARPAERSYSQREFDGHMAEARRSFEAQALRERQSAIDAARSEWEQRNAPKPAADDPWSGFDPSVAGPLKALFEHEFNSRFAPVKQQQEDLAFKNDEAKISAKFSDYEKNRADILNYGIANGIPNLEAAYRAWKFDEFASIDPKKIARDAVAEYTKKKTAQAISTPAVEGRGGGAPSSKQKPKDRDEMDEEAKALFRAAEDSTA